MENEKIVETVAKLETKVEQHDKEIDELKDTTKLLHEMSANIKILALQGTTQTEKIDNIECKVEKLDKDLNDVKIKDDKRDANKWREVVKYIVIFVLGVVLTIVKQKIGL